MTEKRKDSKGRLLRSGESQRADGRYSYKYMDLQGNTKFLYSWRLVPTDRLPKGKRDCIPLRQQEQEIQKALAEGRDFSGQTMPLYRLYEKQNASRSNVRKKTQQGRNNLMRLLKQDKLGKMRIDRIKSSDAREWVLRMHRQGHAYQSIRYYKQCLKAAFHLAIQEDYLQKNPFDFPISDVLQNDTKPREALTEAQEKMLLDFVQTDSYYKRYYDEILVLLHTGLRISEFCGLTVSDVDMENRWISVNHQLLYGREYGGNYIEVPKTKNGIRAIPMSETVYQAFQRILERRDPQPIEIDGYRDFLFLNQKGEPANAHHYWHILQHIVGKYNRTHAEPLPRISPHILRHTFCTRLINRGMNPKSVQYLMGHSDISITLNLYAHASKENVQEELTKLLR